MFKKAAILSGHMTKEGISCDWPSFVAPRVTLCPLCNIRAPQAYGLHIFSARHSPRSVSLDMGAIEPDYGDESNPILRLSSSQGANRSTYGTGSMGPGARRRAGEDRTPPSGESGKEVKAFNVYLAPEIHLALKQAAVTHGITFRRLVLAVLQEWARTQAHL